MVSPATFRKMALSFPQTFEAPHFDRTSFRAVKKIFATMEEEKKLANIKLSPIDQDVFCKFNRSIIYPVPNKWGLQG